MRSIASFIPAVCGIILIGISFSGERRDLISAALILAMVISTCTLAICETILERGGNIIKERYESTKPV